MCGGIATILMKHGGVEIGYTCFPCANDVMLELGFENMRGGGTIEQTVDGYVRWRDHVGHPLTPAEAASARRLWS